MTTENWRGELIREMPFLSEQSLGTINTLLSKERNEAYEKGFTTGRQGVELERNTVLSEVKKEVEELNKLSLCGKCEISTKNELSHTQLCNYKKKISTLLENLKVK